LKAIVLASNYTILGLSPALPEYMEDIQDSSRLLFSAFMFLNSS
jgi:hypothetical protein